MNNKVIIPIYSIFLLILITMLASADPIHDADQDGVFSNEDNCPETYNPGQEDSDNDGIGDLCDASPGVVITEPEIVIEEPEIIVNDTDDEDDDRDRKKRSRSSGAVEFLNFCNVNWDCSGWSECENGVKKRQCFDTNHCEFKYNKPVEKAGCEELELSSFVDEDKKNFSGFNAAIIFLTLTGLILIFILVVLLKRF